MDLNDKSIAFRADEIRLIQAGHLPDRRGTIPALSPVPARAWDTVAVPQQPSLSEQGSPEAATELLFGTNQSTLGADAANLASHQLAEEALTHWVLGRFVEAERVLNRAIRSRSAVVPAPRGNFVTDAYQWAVFSWLKTAFSDPAAGLQFAVQALRMLRCSPEPHSCLRDQQTHWRVEADLLACTGAALLVVGKPASGQRLLQRAVTLHDRGGDPLSAVTDLLFVATALSRRGQLLSSLQCLVQAQQRCETATAHDRSGRAKAICLTLRSRLALSPDFGLLNLTSAGHSDV